MVHGAVAIFGRQHLESTSCRSWSSDVLNPFRFCLPTVHISSTQVLGPQRPPSLFEGQSFIYSFTSDYEHLSALETHLRIAEPRARSSETQTLLFFLSSQDSGRSYRWQRRCQTTFRPRLRLRWPPSIVTNPCTHAPATCLICGHRRQSISSTFIHTSFPSISNTHVTENAPSNFISPSRRPSFSG